MSKLTGGKGSTQQQAVPQPQVDYTSAYESMASEFAHAQADYARESGEYQAEIENRTSVYQQQLEAQETARLGGIRNQAATVVGARIDTARSNAKNRGIQYTNPSDIEMKTQIETEYQRLLAYSKGDTDTSAADQLRMDKAARDAKGRGLFTVKDPLEDTGTLATTSVLGG